MKRVIKHTLFLSCLLVGAASKNLYSQPENSLDNLLILPPLSNISSVPWKERIYRFPTFQKGKITYTIRLLEHEFEMNYNLYFEKMDFISSNGDTLNITNTRDIKEIQIGETWFFHDYKTGYYEIILKVPVALAVKEQFIFQNRNVRGAVQFIDERGAPAEHDRFYKILPKYFFIDKENKVHAATKASILKLFPAHKKEVSAYLREHTPDFQSRKELMDLLIYCSQFDLPK